MTSTERNKLLKIRCASKQGHRLHPEDQKFCAMMFEKYPEEYRQMSDDVFRLTNPNPLANGTDACSYGQPS